MLMVTFPAISISIIFIGATEVVLFVKSGYNQVFNYITLVIINSNFGLPI